MALGEGNDSFKAPGRSVPPGPGAQVPGINTRGQPYPTSTQASCTGPWDLIGSVANETIASPSLCLMNSNLLESIEGCL